MESGTLPCFSVRASDDDMHGVLVRGLLRAKSMVIVRVSGLGPMQHCLIVRCSGSQMGVSV